MTSAVPVQTMDEDGTVRKAEWAGPTLTRLDLGDAEASDGPGPDGGLAS
jgi:hypothetical protein